ncbi:RNA methyltransferase [Magnetovibrio blakemorei]|uniref:rRNA methyltransferase n=1 Tax=Magnetovibrio blakemorei TaxID=28181 RepID=A0A1E5Q374_9PROT|nr:RNA methyltransferase [Magnetovibrio blakemorei]OEJ64052.1 rRNA methyltransferase [Magnetovibrio blakemorei]
MRGYFGVGVERISKSMNAGAIFRTAHAFGAGFVFTVAAQYKRPKGVLADTSKALEHLPFYGFPNINEMILPDNCRLVGVELTDDAIDIRSFRHPSQCAYVLGPERGSLSPEMVEKCEFVVKIPTRFCINVSVAAAMVLYDRSLSMGRFAERPVRAGGPHTPLEQHQHGGPILRRLEKFRKDPPIGEDFDPHGFSA